MIAFAQKIDNLIEPLRSLFKSSTSVVSQARTSVTEMDSKRSKSRRSTTDGRIDCAASDTMKRRKSAARSGWSDPASAPATSICM